MLFSTRQLDYPNGVQISSKQRRKIAKRDLNNDRAWGKKT